MKRHIIGALNVPAMFTLDHHEQGHDFYLPDPGQNATLTINCQDVAGVQYTVASVQLTKGQNSIFWLDPSKYAFTPWVSYILQPGSSQAAPAIPYSFLSHKHNTPPNNVIQDA